MQLKNMLLFLCYTHTTQGTTEHGDPWAGEAGQVQDGPAGGADPPCALDDRICSPPFMELTSLCGDDTVRQLEKNGLAFPFSTYPLGSAGAGHGWGGTSRPRWV